MAGLFMELWILCFINWHAVYCGPGEKAVDGRKSRFGDIIIGLTPETDTSTPKTPPNVGDIIIGLSPETDASTPKTPKTPKTPREYTPSIFSKHSKDSFGMRMNRAKSSPPSNNIDTANASPSPNIPSADRGIPNTPLSPSLKKKRAVNDLKKITK